MIIYKSPEEIAKMRIAGEIVAAAIAATRAAVAPGVTTWDLDQIAEAVIRDRGGVPSFIGYGAGPGRPGFTGSICTSINHEIVHGIPSKSRKLRAGDLISLDFGAIWESFHGDAAVTVFAGEAPNAQAADLVSTTERALWAGIDKIKEGAHLSDIGSTVQEVAEAAGFSVVREYVGHGIGRHLHEDPQVPNHGKPGRGPVLKPGLVIAIEPMINIGTYETEVLADTWTVVTADSQLSAHFEHTIALTDDGPEVLTAPR